MLRVPTYDAAVELVNANPLRQGQSGDTHAYGVKGVPVLTRGEGS